MSSLPADYLEYTLRRHGMDHYRYDWTQLHQRRGVLTVLLTAFGRAVSEVGAVMIVGGNIEGVTRVMTTAIALETSKGDLPLALALGLVLLGVVGALNALAALVRWRGRRVVTPQGVR